MQLVNALPTPAPAAATARKAIDPRIDRQLRDAAQEYEAVFIGEMLGHMFDGAKPNPMFGGGPGEATYRSLLTEQYAKTISSKGGIGLAQPVYQEMLKIQEGNNDR